MRFLCCVCNPCPVFGVIQVESSVVRIEPKSPPPPINFLEWDGMVRLCFSRKNKTLRAIFNNKHVLELMEKNYRTFCALNSVAPASSEQIKEVVLKILEQTDLSDKRSTKLEQDDFLKYANTRAHTHASTGSLLQQSRSLAGALLFVSRLAFCSVSPQTPRRLQSSWVPFQHGSWNR